jgi:hypothetical protein
VGNYTSSGTTRSSSDAVLTEAAQQQRGVLRPDVISGDGERGGRGGLHRGALSSGEVRVAAHAGRERERERARRRKGTDGDSSTAFDQRSNTGTPQATDSLHADVVVCACRQVQSENTALRE